MSVNRRCCNSQFDFSKKPRTGSITSRKRRASPRLTPPGMTTAAWKRIRRKVG